nr:DUF3014 domain-containing protein [Fulvimonas soli]
MAKKQRQSSDRWLVTIVVLLALAAAGVLVWRKWAPTPAGAPAPAPAPAASAARPAGMPPSAALAAPTAAPAPASTAQLPALDDSDADVAAALAGLAGGDLRALLLPDQVVRRIVATVDALPRQALPVRLLPLRTPRGAFLVAEQAGGATIDPRNAARYQPYLRLAAATDPQALARWYARAYPLFQQAYRELGYPKGQFHDRLLAAIDDMLAAPEPAAPPALVRPKVFYEFADPGLEARSAGQKLMIRLGPDGEAAAKARLRALREALAAVHPAG